MDDNSSDWPVHQLWPLSEGNQTTKFDVFFFHGLQLTENDAVDAWRSTWTQRGNDDICWPKEWLPFDLGEPARIFSISYNAHVVTSPYDDVSEIAHNLFQNLMDRRHGWYYPIVLIGHSFGGLVLKSLVVQLKTASTIRNPTDALSESIGQRAKMFLKNVKGVGFYAVPHAGCNNIAKYVSKLIRCTNKNYCGIIRNMQPWKRDMERLSVDFVDIANENQINVYAFCEGRATKQMEILVDFSSAQRLARYNVYMVEDADHMDVCKPPSKAHPSYRLLLQLINICQEVGKENDQTLKKGDDAPYTSHVYATSSEQTVGKGRNYDMDILKHVRETGEILSRKESKTNFQGPTYNDIRSLLDRHLSSDVEEMEKELITYTLLLRREYKGEDKNLIETFRKLKESDSVVINAVCRKYKEADRNYVNMLFNF